MDCRAVCVSGPDGAHMREVARGVAERLGFALVDEEIVFRASAESGIEPEVVADAEKRRSFMERAFDALGNPDLSGFGGFGAPETHVNDELRDLIRAAIEEAAERGSVVIVSHAASHALASQPDVLRV